MSTQIIFIGVQSLILSFIVPPTLMSNTLFSQASAQNTIDCGEPLTIITKKNRAAEIPPVSRIIVNDETKRFQCEENEGKEDKINLKEGDKVRVIAQNERVKLQADGIFLFEEGFFFTDRVFVDTAERISDQEIKFEVPEDVDKDIDSIIFNGLVRGDEDDRIEYITHNVKVRR
jgi:hypothetical protein